MDSCKNRANVFEAWIWERFKIKDGVINISQVCQLGGEEEQGAEGYRKIVTSGPEAVSEPCDCCFIRREQVHKRNRRFNHNRAG